MKKFSEFCWKKIDNISDDVVVATTNYGNHAGRWTVGLQSEATHNGRQLAGTPSAMSWPMSRGRAGRPSGICIDEEFRPKRVFVLLIGNIGDKQCCVERYGLQWTI